MPRPTFRFPWRTRRQIADEVDDELSFHLELRARELAEGGLTPEAARAEAERQFGDLEYTRAYCRDLERRIEADTRRTAMLNDLRQDVRYAARALRSAPGFAAVAALTLALGIGATTTIFSVVDGVLLRPLPYAEAERLVRVVSLARGQRGASSPADVADWRAGTTTLAGIAAYAEEALNLTGAGGEPERVSAAAVSADMFSLVRTRPLVGRLLVAGEDAPGAPPVVVLSERLWRRRFGGERALVGRAITLDGTPHTVVGVARAADSYPADVDLWRPLVLEPAWFAESHRGTRWLRAVGRLKDDVPIERARTEMAAIARRLELAYPDKDANYGVEVVTEREALLGPVRRPLLILLGAVGLVLLIACANVANLQLVRAAAREGEMAVRTALGATRGRLARQLVTESVLLSILGGAAGVGLAAVATRLFVTAAPPEIPRLAHVALDARVLAFAAAVTVLTGILFGVLPALRGAAAPDLTTRLRESGRGAEGGAPSGRARGALIVAEMALAVMLLVGAGLLMRSFVALQRVDPGFRAAQVVKFDLTLPERSYATDARLAGFADALLARLARTPGVRSAAAVSSLPMSGNLFGFSFTVAGRPPAKPGEETRAQFRFATADYFSTLGIPLRRGRAFTAADRAGSRPVLVISEETARRYFAGEDPIGKQLATGYRRGDTRLTGEIVGVVGSTRQLALDRDPGPEVYVPYAQMPTEWLAVVVRTTGDAAPVMRAARAAVRDLDRDLPVEGLQPLAELVGSSVAEPRFYTLLLGTFAGFALLLSAVGIYGVVSYTVSRRTREIGVRIALGATATGVLRLVVGQGMLLVLAGVSVGVAAALAATRVLGALLYGVGTHDAATFVGVAVTLAAVAALATYLPARRAARVDPVTALRAE